MPCGFQKNEDIVERIRGKNHMSASKCLDIIIWLRWLMCEYFTSINSYLMMLNACERLNILLLFAIEKRRLIHHITQGPSN